MRIGAAVAVLMVVACAPQPEVHSVDLSTIRVGTDRAAIEQALGVATRDEPKAGRVVAIYRYGPRVAPGAAMACQPLTLGMHLSCAILSTGRRMLAEEAAEARAATLGDSLLEVIYGADGRAEWVVFAGSPAALARMDKVIAAAECGDGPAQAEIASSYALGANGLPFDRAEAYRWARLASRQDALADPAPIDRVTAALADDRRQAIDREVDQWQPLRPCP